jgi:hypothetical protein
MNNPKTYNLPEVFNNTSMGFVFEFYSSKDVNFIVKELSALTSKGIMVSNSDIHGPSYAQAVLIKEYLGLSPSYSFIKTAWA